MSDKKWAVGKVEFVDRMPPLDAGDMDNEQRKVAEALIAGPRKGIKGPFVPLLRSPRLVDRLAKVGEYLRFDSSLEARISEFITLIVSREWTNHFEWFTHVPLGRKAGLKDDVIAALAEGRRPYGMGEDEGIAYDFCEELFRTKGVSEDTYQRAVRKFSEKGVIDIAAVAGYFAMVSMVMNVAHTPPPEDRSVSPLLPFPN